MIVELKLDSMIMKSSTIRTSLAKYVRQVISSEADVVIEHDGKNIAVLSLKSPSEGTIPLRMKIADAQAGWADLLNIVALRGARYYFKLKARSDEDETPKVYLYRYKQCNRFVEEWNKHRSAQICSDVDAKNSLEKELEEIRKNIEMVAKQLDSVTKVSRWTFAAVNRDGHLLNTPEMGVLPIKGQHDSDDSEEDLIS
jgi:gamma-glutamyl:cysteine ligase YbdK (ATP-grasp superfamily)